ncbi:DinB family protein [Adhaeribacter radiodurans]|uniref:DinB family protein n=1 Tax=Adhaeribacter radiodurans TaxID=2745197 RepID=A0A7L7LFG2_9BACT|nr:DinB family protein [Adhaeribacter radiodurans]
MVADFTFTIDIWLAELEQYTLDQLLIKPSPENWSMGQVYVHLLDATAFFMEQVKACLITNSHAAEEAAPVAKLMFQNNSFPDAVLEGPSSNAHTPQPASKEQLTRDLIALKSEITQLGILLQSSEITGKTKHPGLKYFNAQEWLQFAEIHFRHHLRQKQRIDDFLNRTAAF